METPDYQGGSIFNLMVSITRALGAGDETGEPLVLLPPDRPAAARKLLLLVIDGLGHGFLAGPGAGGHLHGHLLGAIGSVVPPTTASAIPLFLTGAPPALHGFTGWFTWLRELGCVSAVLPFTSRHGGAPLGEDWGGPRALSAAGPVFDRIPVPCHLVSPAHIAFSVFNRAFSGAARIHAFEGLTDMFGQIRRVLREPGPGYVYAYWPGFDALAHEHGIGSAQVLEHFAALDGAFGRLLADIRGTDTAVLVTADHGFVDSPPERQLQLADHPDLARCLTLPLCGEPRFVYCYLDPARVSDFQAYVAEALAGQAELYPSAELIRRGLFGPGPVHPRLHERVGHFVLVMRENYVLRDRLPGERVYRHVGVHGGLSRDELYVPLVYVET